MVAQAWQAMEWNNLLMRPIADDAEIVYQVDAMRELGFPSAKRPICRVLVVVNQLGDVVGALAKEPVKFGKTLINGTGQVAFRSAFGRAINKGCESNGAAISSDMTC